jgi:twitching motility protein PilU
MIDLPNLGPLLDEMIRHNASDLYLTFGCPPSLRLSDRIAPLGNTTLDEAQLDAIIRELLDEEQRDEYEATLEMNTSIGWRENARFRN